MYSIFDSYGEWVGSFPTYKAAMTYIISRNRYDWRIKQKQVTEKQKRAVQFCESMLNISFNGNLNDYNQVSKFLSNNLDSAKIIYEECLACSDILDRDYYD
jgi:hypothetical protein